MHLTTQHIITSTMLRLAAAFLTWHFTDKTARKVTEQIPFLLGCSNIFMKALQFSAEVERKLTFRYEYTN
jgi:hypothetical protein